MIPGIVQKANAFRAVAILALWFSGPLLSAQVRLTAAAGVNVLDGDSPHLVVSGLEPGQVATIHAFRTATAYDPGTYKPSPVMAHAQASFIADSHGRIDLDTAAPIRGTYLAPDPQGLLWSGISLPPAGDPTQPITQNVILPTPNDIAVRVESPANTPWPQITLHLTDAAETLDLQDVALPGLNGAFARPKAASARPLPSIILLHGSEGGNQVSARAAALRFAHLGYAAFALNYFIWPPGVAGIPQTPVNVPVEEVAAARTWLASQPQVDTAHTALWGVSKGAELALVAAAHYPWVDRVVACVPSSVVWSGFGRAAAPGEVFSTWSIDGKPLPYVELIHYPDVTAGKSSFALIHRQSLAAATPAQRAAARIPIENSHANILLLASWNDVVWPSGVMTQQMQDSLAGSKTTAHLQTLIAQNASHYICGTGSETRRINPVHKPEGDDPTPEADAQASHAAWQATQAFLQR